MRHLLTVEQAVARILERIAPLDAELVPVGAAAGRVLKEDAHSSIDLPPFPSSAMDGFAVSAADTPGELPVVFRVSAGSAPSAPQLPGTASGITTGGVMPEGTDAVVPVEHADDHGDRITVARAVSVGEHVRPRGGDVRHGDLVLHAGQCIRASHVGALAAAGVVDVVCSARPRVAVLPTGSELRAAGERLALGEIYESNGAMLASLLPALGADVERMPVVEDEPNALRDALATGLDADVLVTTGGVSMGPRDLVRGILGDLGVEEIFWGVAVKPGKPLSYGVRGRTHVFGLPGNPVSSLVGALVFVRPALRALQGHADPGGSYEPGVLASELRRNPHRDEFVRARRRRSDDGVELVPVSGQESHMIVRAATADALVHLPRGSEAIPAGARVHYLPLD